MDKPKKNTTSDHPVKTDKNRNPVRMFKFILVIQKQQRKKIIFQNKIKKLAYKLLLENYYLIKDIIYTNIMKEYGFYNKRESYR